MRNVVSSSRAITNHAVEVQFLGQCMDGYLEWYLTVSHPHIIPPVEHAGDGGTFDDVPLTSALPPAMDDEQRLQMITVFMDNLVGLVNLDGEVCSLTSQTSHIFCKRLVYIYFLCYSYIICSITQTFEPYSLLDNTLSLSLLQD